MNLNQPDTHPNIYKVFHKKRSNREGRTRSIHHPNYKAIQYRIFHISSRNFEFGSVACLHGFRRI